jgi:hypothetical protein
MIPNRVWLSWWFSLAVQLGDSDFYVFRFKVSHSWVFVQQ